MPVQRPADQTQQRPRPEPEQTQPRPAGNVCDLPTSMGDCDNWELKWSYNSTGGHCEQFYYGGCGGNENRFNTEEDCSARCIDNIEEEPEQPVDTSKCYQSPEAGNCYESITRWYYNHQDGLCDEFVYTGCGGNENNYASEEECQNACYDVDDTCSLPPVRGQCNEISSRWHFDKRTGSCHEFEFTGCRGNRNNFVTERQCQDYCLKGQVPSESQPEPEPEPQPPVEVSYRCK